MDEISNNQVVIGVDLDRELFNRDLVSLQQDLERIRDIRINIDSASVTSKINEIKRALDNTVINVNFRANIANVLDAAEQIKSESINLRSKINVDNTQALSAINALPENTERIRTFIRQNPIDIPVHLLETADKDVARYITRLQVKFNENKVTINPRLTTADGVIKGFVSNIEKQIFAARPTAIVGVEPSAASLRSAISSLQRQAVNADIKTTLELDDSSITKSFDKLAAFTSSLTKTTKFIETGGFDVLMAKFDTITSRYIDLATLMANVVLTPSTDTTELILLLNLLDSIKSQINSLKGATVNVNAGSLKGLSSITTN
ncbi:MAG: hypothetical protein ACRDBG_17935, partial [Waterburya sp.]